LPRASGDGEPSRVVGGGRSGGWGPLPEFEWDENNEFKLLERHDVSALEAEQCFANRHTRRRGRDGANLLLGRTDVGRLLFLVYEQRPSGIVKVYSAREMTQRERRAFRRATND
jgi:uncharacterized DUF497 family protein